MKDEDSEKLPFLIQLPLIMSGEKVYSSWISFFSTTIKCQMHEIRAEMSFLVPSCTLLSLIQTKKKVHLQSQYLQFMFVDNLYCSQRTRG